MDKWSKIKHRIYSEKLNVVNGLFIEVAKNINSGRVPREQWTVPLDNWAADQITKDGSLSLSLQEFTHFKKLLEDLNQHFLWRNNEKSQVIKEFKQEFQNDYIEILQDREDDLKLEVTAELIEEKQFPLELFVEFYNLTWHLPAEQFNEELGSFWGDVWRHALGGAGVGAGLSSATGFADTGLSTLAGAGLGGLYGGGKNILQRIWHYRQTRRNFEQTKEKALDSLKKLREISKGFDMNPNFLTSLNTMIDQLGTARAYRVAGSAPTDADAIPGKAVDPTKIPTKPAPDPRWAELGKYSAPSSAAPSTPSSAAPSTPSSAAPSTPSSAAPSTPTTPKPPTGPLTTPKPPTGPLTTPKPPTGPVPRPEGEIVPGGRKSPIGSSGKPPTGPVPRPEGEVSPKEAAPKESEITSAADIVDLFKKGDLNTKHKIGQFLQLMNKKSPADFNNEELKDFNDFLKNMPVDEPISDENQIQDDIKAGNEFVKNYEEKRIEKPGESIPTKSELPTAEKPVIKNKEDAAALAPEKTKTSKESDFKDKYTAEEIKQMKPKKLKDLATHIGIQGLFDSESTPSDYRTMIQDFYNFPNKYAKEVEAARAAKTKTESVVYKYEKMLREHRLATLPIPEKVQYLKSLLKG